MRLLLLGNPGIEHVGSHFREAAMELGIETIFINAEAAFEGRYLERKVNWWLRGHRPSRLREMSATLAQICKDRKPDLLLTTGFAPLNIPALQDIGAMGIPRLNYLTDDPWNRFQNVPWFVRALRQYDCVFSPRRSNMGDLRGAGCRRVEYLPFAYAPHVHFPEAIGGTQMEQLRSDVIFAGGGDKDRTPYIGALRQAGFRIALYGGYWDRYAGTKGLSRGLADPALLRKAMAAAKVALCLVRRQNRDGHCMRTFELPAYGACALVERTKEHEEIFGADSNAVVYFDSIPGMIEKMHWLLAHDAERRRLGAAAHSLIVSRRHTYRDRLQFIVESALSHYAQQRSMA